MSFFPTDGGNGIFGQGSFTIDQNSTPEMIQAKRAQIAALMPQYGKAKYVGEGFGQLFQGIATGRKNKALDKFEGDRRQEAAGQFNGVMSGGSRASGPMSVLGMRPETQSPDQRIADDTMTALGQPKQGGDRDAFIQQMMPHAQRVAQQTGLDPRIIIAQAAQETGWGKSAPGNNYFGIKSHGQAGGNTFATNEVVDGQTVRVNDSFRGYEGMGDSVDGYAQFLQDNPRYKDMLSAGDLDSQVAALGQSGYATDPNYANSVGSIARSIQIPQGGTQVAQNGGRLNDLMMAAQNPWLSTQQRKVINAQIQQEQGQQQMQQERQMGREDFLWKQENTRVDPLDAVRLEQARLNLEQDRNPTPGYNMLSPDEVAQNGLPAGAYQRGADGKISKIGGNGVTVNNNMGGPEAGRFIYAEDAGLPKGWRFDTQTQMAERIPGGPDAIEAEQDEVRNATKDQQQIMKLGTTLSSINLNLNEIDDGGLPVTGPVGDLRRTWLGRAVTGSGAMDFGNRTNQITDSAALAEIQNMRDNSKTGGAVGSLTDSERVAIGNSVTALNNSTSQEEYARAARAYRDLSLDLAFKGQDWSLNDDGTVTVTPKLKNGAGDFSQMSMKDLSTVDIMSLDEKGMDDWEARMQELKSQ